MVQIIPADRITIPPRRQRTSMDVSKLNDLIASIRDKGLLHPPVFRELPGENGKIYQLVAGERRIKALRQLAEEGHPVSCDNRTISVGFLPITLIGELTSLQQKEAELEENILREDLSWQDRDRAIAELHELRLSQNPNQTIIDTAQEIAQVQDRTVHAVRAEVTRAKIVAKHLDDPRIAAARNSREAYALVSKDLERTFRMDLAKATGEKTEHQFIQANLLEWLPQYSGPPFDLILADPPYGIGADQFGNAGSMHDYEDTPEQALQIRKSILANCFRITKPSAHLYLFVDFRHFESAQYYAELNKWSAWPTPIIWYKGSRGHDPLPGIGFRRTYETILYCWKGDRPCLSIMDDVLTVQMPAETRLHAAEKPVELFRRLIARSCHPGDSVLDPCCGSGTIFPAATKCLVNATGIEISPTYAKVADARRFEKE